MIRWEYANGADGLTDITVTWLGDHETSDDAGWYLDAIGPDADWHVSITSQKLGTRESIHSAMAEAARVVEAAGA